MHNLIEKFTPEAVEAPTADEGLTMVEYAVAASVIAIAAAAAFTLVGTNVAKAINDLAGKITG
jgi:Flp pilus assembly pilin Flp